MDDLLDIEIPFGSEEHDPEETEEGAGEEEEEREAGSEESDHSDDAIKIYLKEVQKTRLLTAEDERQLALRIAQGDEAARDRMIESNLRLVIKIAKRYLNRGLPFLDLIAEGNLGLIKAVGKFKVSKECRFSTYATWWIRQSIERALVNQGRTIRLPVHISDEVTKLIRISRELLQKGNREPEVNEIAEAMGMESSQVSRLMVLVKKTYSIEHPMGDDGDYTLIDTIEDTTFVNPSTLVEDLDKFIQVSESFQLLSENEREILTLRFGLDDTEPETLETIGQRFGVTRERIRQIEAKTLQKLRKVIEGRDPQMQALGDDLQKAVIGGAFRPDAPITLRHR